LTRARVSNGHNGAAWDIRTFQNLSTSKNRVAQDLVNSRALIDQTEDRVSALLVDGIDHNARMTAGTDDENGYGGACLCLRDGLSHLTPNGATLLDPDPSSPSVWNGMEASVRGHQAAMRAKHVPWETCHSTLR
jgi:hypothetical protein